MVNAYLIAFGGLLLLTGRLGDLLGRRRILVAGLGAELVATSLVRGTALPVGVVTRALGAPFLISLLVTTNRVGRGG